MLYFAPMIVDEVQAALAEALVRIDAVAALDLTGRVAIVVGNEAHGLDDGIEARIPDRVTIPMASGAESLNVAMTAAVLCFEAARQRR